MENLKLGDIQELPFAAQAIQDAFHGDWLSVQVSIAGLAILLGAQGDFDMGWGMGAVHVQSNEHRPCPP